MEEGEAKTILQKMMDEINNRPFYEKWASAIYMFFVMVKLTVRHHFLNSPTNIYGMNSVADSIKDDIEFGYNQEMIYNKIIHGNYGNDPYTKKQNWFAVHGIDWKKYLQKEKINNNQWIHVYNLLPEHSEYVWVFDGDNIFDAYLLGNGEKAELELFYNTKFDDGNYFLSPDWVKPRKNITHWKYKDKKPFKHGDTILCPCCYAEGTYDDMKDGSDPNKTLFKDSIWKDIDGNWTCYKCNK